MGCLPLKSDRQREADSKFRFSWSFFRGISEGKRRPNSASHNSFESNGQDQSSSRYAASLALTSREAYPLPVKIDDDPRARDVPNASESSLTQSTSGRTSELRVFTYAELRAACQGFSRSNLVGEGGFGCVYRGVIKNIDSEDLKSSTEVAVKILNRNSLQGHKEWLAEVRFLGLVEHPNLVKLVGYCAEDDARGIQRLLVYEFIARGSLEDYLFAKNDFILSWQQRLGILLGAARGLAYLHQEIEGIQVIFRDFKTSNVLLEEDFTPKLSDFGLARQGPEMGATHVSTSVVGTIGYAAPEYVQTGHLTSKSDVWSFGVVLFEMLTARRSVDRNRPKSEQHLLEWVRPYIHSNKKVHCIVDPRLQGDYSLVQVQKLVELAHHCCHRAPKVRPSMSSVVRKLNSIIEDASISHTHADVTQGKEGNSKAESKPLEKRKHVIGEAKRRTWTPKAISM